MKNIKKKSFLSGVTEAELKEFLEREGEASYRASQIFNWIYHKCVINPDEMKNIPKNLREKIKENFICNSSSVEAKESASDGTEKLLIRLSDGEAVEAVIIPSPDRVTFCLSTQVGCPVQCRFCASGRDGLIRNMTAGEISEEFFIACAQIQRLPDNLVFMGIGEGLMNFAHLSRALEIISSQEYVGLSGRRITVSTSGWPQGIRKLADLERPFNLAVSLHAANDQTRARLIPDKFRRPIKDIIDACMYFKEKTGRIFTFEYTLIKGINDSMEDAIKLAEIARNCGAKVNLIPYNDVGISFYARPSKETLLNFENTLKQRGAKVTLRIEKGSSVKAACGQLRAKGIPRN